jgi:Lrp/AsnC family transcriptional regulator, leucine-responsive regulatory protein
VDKYDDKIVALLSQDGRLSISKLAEAVALSRSAVSERLKRLEERGIILGYRAVLAEPQGQISAFFELSFRTPRCEQYGARIGQIPEVRLCYSISGDTDMLVQVRVASMTRLDAIRQQLEALPQLSMIKTHAILSELVDRTR